jgi:hypothetical protein
VFSAATAPRFRLAFVQPLTAFVAKYQRFVAFEQPRGGRGGYGRMLLHAVLIIVLGFFNLALRAQDSLDNARRAQALLGSGVWSQVIQVTNESRGRVYPAIVHAVVFELAGILWFYTDANGTQSFSLHVGCLEAEKADFAPLLVAIERGFTRWSVVPDTELPAKASNEPLKNGCFVESVAAWRERLARRTGIREPRLLSYYVRAGAAEAGHTVLAYEVDGRVEVFDPARPSVHFRYPQRVGRDALWLAKSLEGGRVRSARYVPMPEGLPATAVASTAGEGRTGMVANDLMGC